MRITDKKTRPKYKKVEDAVRKLVDDSAEGARLPSERELANILKVSFLTVRKGLLPLVVDGTIERRAGVGTYVSSKVNRELPIHGQGRVFSGKVGVLVFRDSDTYAHKVLHAIDEVASEEKLELRHAWISDLGATALQRVHDLKNEGVTTLVIPWIPPGVTSKQEVELRQFVTSCPIPVTLRALIPGLERFSCTSPALYGSDLIASTDVLCSYFKLLGHKRIALLAPDDVEDLLIQKKLAGYTHFVCKAGLESHVALAASSQEAIRAVAEKWLPYRGDLAVVSYDDDYALKFMAAMAGYGCFAPKDFAIIGFNNIEASGKAHPPLTTVSPDYTRSVRDLLRSAIGAVTGVCVQSDEKSPPLRFIVRDTCGGSSHVERVIATMGARLNVLSEH
ncbi:MAG: substrate-binding domain-containing protein [Rariglobus sp.]|nr:substrate-binding domain-containing protein [Rariglobus sp.]